MSSIAVVFPGQGSQHEGMLKDFAEQYPITKELFDKASQIVGKDLWKICQNDEFGYLNQTEYTQPIILTANYVCFQILKENLSIKIDYMAGHSLGEYSALLAANALTFQEAVHLVNMRGKIMQETVPSDKGAMAAILGLDDDIVREICNLVDGTVAPANFNSPGQVVIAGYVDAVNNAIEECKKQGAKRAILLPVSIPSHCSLMRPAAAKFSLYLDQIKWKSPDTPIIYNVDAKTRATQNGIESALGEQLYSPVQWTKTIEHLSDLGVTHCIEVGSGKVLSGLNKRITNSFNTISFNQIEDIEKVKDFIGV